MKDFHFKKFTLKQSRNVFRVGTDGLLLGVLCTLENSDKILEVGTGSGIISLMIAQRNKTAQITAIEINLEAVILTQLNFQNSPFHSRLNVVHHDFKNFKSDKKFDVVISNPPYFEENSSQKDILARQQKELDFQSLIENSAAHLSKSGCLSVIIPSESQDFFEKNCNEKLLFLRKQINIFGKPDSKAKRVVLEFGFNQIPVVEEDFIIEKSPRIYSDQYLELTKDFHVFKGN